VIKNLRLKQFKVKQFYVLKQRRMLGGRLCGVVRRLVGRLGQRVHVVDQLVTVRRAAVFVSNLVDGFQQHVRRHVRRALQRLCTVSNTAMVSSTSLYSQQHSNGKLYVAVQSATRQWRALRRCTVSNTAMASSTSLYSQQHGNGKLYVAVQSATQQWQALRRCHTTTVDTAATFYAVFINKMCRNNS